MSEAGGRSILVVDDEDDFRASVGDVLETEGWEVREARHGAEALEILATWRPSVMMLDLRMPVLDGTGVLRQLDGSPERPAIVLVTASPQAGEVAQQHQLRFIVTKPFEVEHLLVVLDEAHRTR